MPKKTARWFALILLSALAFTIGLARQEYIINVIDTTLPILIPRNSFTPIPYPFSFYDFFYSIINDPRWTSSIIYLLYPVCSTLLAIMLLFNKKSYLKITLLFYATGLVLLILSITTSILLNNYSWGYGMAQQLKKIYQEPYISLLLIGGFYWDKQNRARAEKESGELRKRT